MALLANTLDGQTRKLCLTTQRSYKTNLYNAPVLLALGTSGDTGVELAFDAEMVHVMRQYRRFDSEYFDRCFALTQHLLLSIFRTD